METSVTFRRCDYNPLILAYMGDSYFETLSREYLIGDGNVKLAELNEASKKIVTASSQSAFVERLLPLLDDEELAIYKGGRNAKSAHRSKSSSALDYRRATGLECLYGYFWFTGRHKRAKELFLLCVSNERSIEI